MVSAASVGARSLISEAVRAATIIGVSEEWTPANSFRSEDFGGNYDLNDLANLFQNTTGITPVSDYGDPVGLVLDTHTNESVTNEIYTSDFTAGSDFWGQNIGDANLQATGNETAPDSTEDCLKFFANGANKSFQIRCTDFNEKAGRRYRVTVRIYPETGAFSGDCWIGYGYSNSVIHNTISRFNLVENQWNEVTFEGRFLFDPESSFRVGFFASSTSGTLRTLQAGKSVWFKDFSVTESVEQLSHATQSVTASRPIYARQPKSGVRNILPESEDYSDFTLVGTGSVTTGYTVNGHDAALVQGNGSGNYAYRNFGSITATNTQYTFSIEVEKSGSNDEAFVLLDDASFGGNRYQLQFVFSTETLTATMQTSLGNGASLDRSSAIKISDNVYRLNVTMTTGSSSSGFVVMLRDLGSGAWEAVYGGAQLEKGNKSTVVQTVVSQYDITEVNQIDVPYLYFDGIDDYLAIHGSDSSMKFMHDGTGGSFVGVFETNKPSDDGTVFTYAGNRANTSSNIGWRIVFDDFSTASARLATAISKGGGVMVVNPVSSNNVIFRADHPQVIRSSYIDQSGDDAYQYIDGMENGSAAQTSSPSTSNSTYDMQIGAHGNSGDFFEGKWFGGLFIDRILNDAENESLDNYFANLTGAVLVDDWTPGLVAYQASKAAQFDITNIASLYQENEGLTAVADYGDPVGLVLDSRFGLAKGPEEISNGDFSNGTTDYTDAHGTLTVSNEIARITNSSSVSSGRFWQTYTTIVGEWYEINVDYIRGDINGVVYANINSNYGGAIAGSGALSESQSVKMFFRATATTTYIILGNQLADENAYNEFDNLSVKKIEGNHAVQSTSSARPTYARHPLSGLRNQLTYTEELERSVWTKASGGTGTDPVVTDNYGIAPDGTQTATRVQLDCGAGTTGSDYSELYQANSVVYRKSVWAKVESGTSSVHVLTTLGGPVTVTTTWKRFEYTAGDRFRVQTRGDATDQSVDLLIWHPQMEPGVSTNDYQKVVTKYDVSEAGVEDVYYLDFDGVDDHLEIPGSDSEFNFMHDGTGGTFVGPISVDDFAGNRTLFATRPVTADIGVRCYIESANERMAVLSSDGTTNYVSMGSSNNSMDVDVISVVRFQYESDDARILVNSGDEGTDTTGTPSTSDAGYDMNIGASAAAPFDYMDGKFYGCIFVDDFISIVQATGIDRHYSELTGASLS